MKVNARLLDFIGDGGRPDVEYKKDDLIYLSNHRTLPLIEKSVRCNILGCHNTQHPVVIRAEDDGRYEGEAVLPCPPHCGGQTGLITFQQFVLGY